MTRRIALLATLDTKGTEAGFLSERLIELGCEVETVDLSLTDEALARRAADKQTRMTLAAESAGERLRESRGRGRLDGVIGIGGGQGTWMATTAMRELPLGVPKLMVSTLPHRAGVYLGASDIVFVPSTTDIAGLNPILRGTLERSAAAVAAMAGVPPRTGGGRLVAVTMLGVTTIGATRLVRRLEELGYETAVFHANGRGGAAMEAAIAAGEIAAVIDWTTAEVVNDIAGGRSTAGPDRLLAAARAGIPAILVPGGLDTVILPDGPPPTDRLLHDHTPVTRLMRSNRPELEEAATRVAAAVEQTRGPIEVAVPERGFSALGGPGQVFEDRAADEAFTRRLASLIGDRCVRVDAHIDAPEFGEHVIDRFTALAGEPNGTGTKER